LYKGLSEKDVRSQRREEVVQCGNFLDKEERVLQMCMFALFGAKHFRFPEIYGVSARTREGG